MHRIVLLFVAASAAFAESGVGSSGGGGGGGGQGTGGGGQTPPDGGGSWIFIAFFVLMGFMLWSTFRSQKKEKQKQQNLIAGLKLGDKIESIGGLRGEIVRKGEGELDIRSGESTFTIALGAVKQLVPEGGAGEKKE